MKNFTILTLFSAILMLCSSCESDFLGLEDSGVFGVVIDAETGNPIPYADVFVNGPESRSIKADFNGNYRFSNLPSGNYVLSANANRFLTPLVNTTVFLGQYTQENIEMEFHSFLSTNVLNFGTEYDELEIVVTNLFNQAIDVGTKEDEHWMTTHHFISGLAPGESDIITVRIQRSFLNSGSYSVPLTVDIEEDFGFDVIESYVVTVNVEE